METKTSAQIQEQITKLQREAAAMKAKEVVGIIESIRDAVGHYGLTVEHLFGVRAPEVVPRTSKNATGKVAAGKKTPAKQSATMGKRVSVKYRDSSGNTWSGRGSQPRWLRAAVEDGMSIEDFAVKK